MGTTYHRVHSFFYVIWSLPDQAFSNDAGHPTITIFQNIFFLAFENKWDVPSFCFEFWPHSSIGAIAPN